MTQRQPNTKPAEQAPVPEGRETPVMGPPKVRRKVRRMRGEPGTARPYEPGAEKPGPADPWQDPGGPEPANG